ncbi:pfkB-like carbohydrate kinase family protein [Actinidia rufa]|uniref:fructokinase n=1 Tax=Actinidia rufa TaxID=165716 RepID=A0A7J0E8E6_9ERIC|nr:pfkB-like carbohydrate kinase family protein [Actinidia rufa]
MLIDFVPTVNGVSLAEAPAFKKSPGGAPANVAVGITRLGGFFSFYWQGDDEFGYMLADILKQNKVNNSGMRFDRSARTALAFVTLQADGEREFLFFRNPSADMLLRESELDVNLIKQARIFHYGSISLIEEPCRSTHLAALSIAKESGCILSYDPNLRLPLWPSADAARKGIMSIWDQADVIKISGDEISFLTGGDDPYDDNVVMEKLFHPKLKVLIVSEGSKGCRYYTKQFKGRVPGVKVKAIDTTGAGDAFVGGLLYSLASDVNLYQDEKRLREALLFANACGALVVKEKGAIPGLPTKKAVLQLLSEETLASNFLGVAITQMPCGDRVIGKRSEWQFGQFTQSNSGGSGTENTTYLRSTFFCFLVLSQRYEKWSVSRGGPITGDDGEIRNMETTNANTHSSLLPEIGPDGLMREAPVIAYTEKIIEAEQLQLKKYV